MLYNILNNCKKGDFMKTYLVTGGAGFIGSNFIRYILKKHDDILVINFDSLTYAGNLNNLKDIQSDKRYKFVYGDITNESEIDDVFKNYEIDYVINFAAESHVDNGFIYPEKFIQTNIVGVEKILKVAKKHWGSDIGKRFVQISTDEVYGTTFEPTDESAKLNPSTIYATTKASADLIALSYFKSYNLPVIITRSVNNYGPYQHHEKLIPKIIKSIKENKNISVYGTGEHIREWIYVLDNCDAIDNILHNGKNGEIYNISTHNRKKTVEIIDFICSYLNKQNIKCPNLSYTEDRKCNDISYNIDSTKIEKICELQKSDFEKTLTDTIKWYMSNDEL